MREQGWHVERLHVQPVGLGFALNVPSAQRTTLSRMLACTQRLHIQLCSTVHLFSGIYLQPVQRLEKLGSSWRWCWQSVLYQPE